ncbi:mitochondrial outer membrane import complex protein METAXIN isoform X1 [Syzygium oleosum]|uniref:mitochondrial outer membrane import complex protein METAXIN isoform X1 n=1 Tax=Syzygium oleosum TaxID=219896 RepID=UPI0011D2BE92|nr:mitochondrial outer membrane import complex protein METAXIN isoform X1 [Syzygium oleosum]
MEGASETEREFTLVARKPRFGLPTACPHCLPVFIYLKLAKIPFRLGFNLTFPDSDQVPYVESGAYVAYNNEKGGVIESLKEDGIVDLDLELRSVPEFISSKAMISSWLEEAIIYELWLGSDGTSAHNIYYADLPWPVGKLLYLKQIRSVKQRLGITKDNAERREAEIYRRAKIVYEALSTMLGEGYFFFGRPSSLDAFFLGHALFTLQALPEASLLRNRFLEHGNLVRYAEKHKSECLEAVSSSSSDMHFPPSSSASAPREGPSHWSSKPKSKPKREKTEEEKTFRKRAKCFLAAQFTAVLLFITIMRRSDDNELDLDDDDGDLDYD